MSKTFGARTILRGLDFEVDERARVGVIGPNGGGKSTMLRLLAGSEQVDAGNVARRRELVTAFLPQQVAPEERTPRQIVRGARPEIARIERELSDCAARLGEPDVIADLDLMSRVLRRQERLLDELDRAGGHVFEGRIETLLLELGLRPEQFDETSAVLSGGQRKLVALAACLARDPDVLLLDEPETHLDAERRSDLERLVRRFDGAVVMVSHDRYLLDETVTTIAELDGGAITLWPGNYSAYAVSRELALQRQEHHYQTQQKEIARLEEMIRRFKQWFNQGDNERFIVAARVKQRQIDTMDKVERPVLERRKMGLRLRSERRGGQRVVELRNVDAAYDGDPILRDVSLTVMRGERVGIIGANGSGKSVLTRLITGELEPASGERWIGPSIELGTLVQEHHPALGAATPIEAVRLQRPCTEGEAVHALMRFLFTYEQVRQSVERLSGGERTRLELLLLMRGGANCLVLDEPTNHLDIDSVEALEGALESYDGTAVFVSHDRYFLDRISDRILEVRDGRVYSSEGGYSAWYARHKSSVAA
ncbi:MAG TPA: ABC-F family ATP-binding cassette domain-containing protein [Gaiellales bacterium]|nr:ABC-F family ATP-binding cassette domain-containing protein [Gaiellales bacterium]